LFVTVSIFHTRRIFGNKLEYNMPPKDPVPVIADDGDDSYTKDKVTECVDFNCRSLIFDNIIIQGSR
jgi:hypothetical protein